MIQLLSYQDVGRTCGVSPRTIRRWVADGRLNPVRLSSKIVRFRETEVNALIKSSENQKSGEGVAE